MPDRDSIRSRFVPAVLTGLGAIFLMAGLLSYTDPITAAAIPSPTVAAATVGASGPLITFPTGPASTPPTPSGSATATAPVDHVATRVVVPALGIDLPIVKGGTGYPLCNVAMYLVPGFHQPGQQGATYIFAHARTGMFLPLLEGSKIDNGRKMKGMLVQVYTSDDQLFLYSISEVRRHVVTLEDAQAETDEVLFLQTSEGPHGTLQKLQVVATPLSAGPADHADAHPTAHPVVCG